MKKYLALVLGGIIWWGAETALYKPNFHHLTKVDAKHQRIGVLSDIHGDKESVSYFLDLFKEKKVDGVVVAGDIANRSQWILSGLGEEIIQLLGQSGLPIYILPGNHDQRYFYEKAMERQTKRYQNLHDLLQERIIDARGIDFISNPSGNGKSYWLSGYYATDYGELEQLLVSFSHDDPLVLITHQPPLCKGTYGVDYILEGKNEGNGELDRIMKKYGIRFSFSGHIHSAANGCDDEGEYIPRGVYSPALRLNPGAVVKHKTKNSEKNSAAVVSVRGKEMRYELLERQ